MADDLILQDADRTKLDGIVQKMTANNENDADIQFVVNDFKQKYGVKKKEVSKPTAQVSSNGTTKTSQSSYNLDLSLPKVNPNPNNKALPGLGQPLKPQINLDFTKDRQKQIIAEKAVTPDYSDYNTVIQQGIKGQNRFDNTMNPLSKPIVEQQAKKEVQQLKKQQEYGNNIITKIPELKNAKNTDEAISAIIKSNRKDDFDYWQQFDDEALLGNDENTLNDFLVSNGLKNQDRELYLKEQASSNPKYGYEYEYNKIGSLFKAVKQRADDYDTVLKQKFGDNYMEVAKQGNSDILNDQDFNKFRQLREKQNELSTKANGLINDSRYSEVKSSREKVEKAQQGVDERAKNDKVYKVGDELNYIGNKLAYGAGHVVKMIAELPSLATSIDKGYDWTDKVADWGNRFSDNLIESIPVSTDKKTGVFNKVADVDGYKVFVDESGEPIDVRDKNNFKVPLSVSQSVVEKFSSNPQTYKTRNEMNSGALVDNGLNTMIDMGIMILGTKGAGMVGAGEKLQKLTDMGIAYQQTKRDVFNDAIKKGLDPRNADLLSNIIGVAAGTSSMLNPMEFNIAKGAGLFNLLKTDGLNAAKLALIKDGKLSVKDYAKEFVSGAIKNTIGENIEELGIESTTQAIANNHFNNQISETDMVDSGLDDRLHILDKQGLETFLITAGSSFLMTPIEINSQTQFNQQEAMKMAIENPEDFAKIKELQLKQGQISQQQFDNETKIYNDVSKTYNAVKDDVKEELQPQLLALLTKKSNLSNKISEIKDEVLSKPYKEQLEQINKGIESISNGKNASESLVAPIEKSETLDEPTETIEELQKNKDLDNKEIDDKILSIDKSQLQFIQDQQKEKLEKQREEQNDYYDSRIKELSSNKLGQSTAKDGSSTITKVETEIANKINKGQELTAEETDYYNAQKDSIDKLVTVNKSPIVPINETVEVEKKKIVLPPPTPQVVAPAELDEQQITEQLNEVLNDKTTPTPLVNTEQEQNISERLPSEYQNNQGVQQINGIGQDVSNESEVPVEQKQAEVIKKANPRIAELPKKKKEVPTEKVEEGVGETESIKNRSRKDLFPDESEFSDVIGGSGKNSKISSYKEVNGIGISEYKNPDSGVVDVIMTGTSDNDYVGYVRIYENGKPTERWTSKMENKSGNKANFKTMISEVKNLLPANHEYTESTNISLDGIRVYANNLTRGYEILTDKDGNPITNNVELNGATLQGLKDAKSDRDVSKLYNKRTGITRDEFNKIREKVNELLPGTRLLFNEANGSVIIKLPVLKSKETAKSNPTDTPEVSKPVSEIAKTPISKTETTAILDEIKSKNLTHVKGKNMGENQALGTFISTEKGNRYETADNKAESVEVDIKNPLVVENDLGLVGKRTEILNNNKDKFTKEDAVDYQELPDGKITLDDLNDAGIKKLAKITTEKLQADGYDGIYFKESKTQEGELVVFDKEKVKFKEQTPIADETPKLKAKEKQDLVKSLNKEQVKEFIKLKTPQEKESYLINLRDKEQKLKNDKHDRLVSLMREYNSTASNRTTRKQEIRQSMLKLSSDLGYSIKAKEGDKLEVLNSNGKLIRKINIPTDEKPATAENIEKVKELTHWFNWNGNDLDFHIDAVKLGLTWQNIRTALADINAGKTESTNINRVANAINEYGNMESLPLVRGFGGNYERLDVTGDDLFWAQKVNEATELLSGYEYNEAEREQALKDLSETDEKEFEQYSDLYSKFVDQDGTLNWEEALKYEQANKTTTDESAKGQGSSNIIGDGKNSQQLQKENRSEAEIKSELKIKEAELKKLEEKQSKLNKQLEENLKENQLDLLQGAKPQAMFDDKAEQQKIAEKSKSDIENKRKEIAKLNEELDNINQGEIPFQSTDKKFTTISQSKFNQLLDKLKKAFPNVKVELFGKSDFDNARKELEKRGIVVTDTKTKDGTIYGFKTPDGKVFLNSDAINANTPIHEFGHVWQSVFPNEFAKGISLLVQSPQGRELINEIRKNPAYKGKSITEIQAEALVTAIGNKGENIFNSNPTLYNKFKQWLNDLFAKIGDKLGIKNLSPDDKFDMFTKKVVGELLGGKVLDSKVGTEKSTEKTIAFQGKDIKVKEINGGAEVVNGFYSPLEKIINETKFEKLPAKQWVDKFAKGEEAKWTGLTDWLNQQQGSVSKSDIQQYLKDNRIQVVEVVKGEDMPNYKLEVEPPTELGADRMDLLGDLGKAGNLDNPRFRDYLNKKYGKNGNKIYDWLVDNATVEGTYSKDTKFSQYQLEGQKENYKEVLVTLPQKKTKKPYEQWLKENFYGEDRKEARDLYAQQIDSKDPNFKSSHFDEPNILVHLRMNTRTDAEGNKVLFLEEVQSDWGQEGKKKGFEEDTTKLKSEYDKIHKRLDELQDLFDNGKKTKELSKEFSELYDQRAKLERDINDLELGKTPTAPFVTDTNAWTKLGLKVALKEAVKQGADKIAWTTGEQQNDRYDLSKQVDEIRAKKNLDGTYKINAAKDGNNIFTDDNVSTAKLPDIVGKELAQKIIDDNTNDGKFAQYKGQDLKVGGKGMKGFYGSPTEGSLGIVGNVAKSLFKQEPKTVDITTRENVSSNDKIYEAYDRNGKLIKRGNSEAYIKSIAEQNNGTYKLVDAEQKSTQHSIDITPEMKAMVELGQPLFQFKPDELTKKVQELRDFELTDEEIRDYLLEAGNTKQQIDDALGVKEVEENKDEVKKELSDSKQRVAERIVLGNSTEVSDTNSNVGVKKRITDARRESLGLKPVELPKLITDKAGMAMAKNAVDNGLVDPIEIESDIVQHEFDPTYAKVSRFDLEVLKYRRLQLEQKESSLFKSKIEINEALSKNPDDVDLIAQQLLTQEHINNNLKDMEQNTLASRMASNVFANLGHGLQTEYNLEGEIQLLIKKIKNNYGENLPEDVKKKLSELEAQNKELVAKNEQIIKRYNDDEALKTKDEFNEAVRKEVDKILKTKYIQKQRLKGKDLIASGVDKVASALGVRLMAEGNERPSLIQGLAEIAQGLIDEGAATISNVMDKLGDYISDKFGDKIKFDEYREDVAEAVENNLDKFSKSVKKSESIDDLTSLLKKKMKELVAKGIESRTEIIENIYEEVKKAYTDNEKQVDFDKRKISDLLSDYGKKKFLSDHPIDVKVRDIKRQLKLASAIEDVLVGNAPLKSGLIPDKISDTVRRMTSEVKDLMKKKGIETQTPEQKWKTALDAIKTRLQNEINDLEKQKEDGKRFPKKTIGIEYDKDANDLKEKRDALKLALDNIIGKEGQIKETIDEIKRIAKSDNATTITKSMVKSGLISDLIRDNLDTGVKPGELLDKVTSSLKDVLPDITEEQLQNAFLRKGDFKSESKTKTQLQKDLSDLKSQLSTQKKIDDLKNGIAAEIKKQGEKSDDVKKLQKDLADQKRKSLNEFANLSTIELQRLINITQNRINKGDFVTPKNIKAKFQSDFNWVKNNQQLENIKHELRMMESKALDEKKSTVMKALDIIDKWAIKTVFFGTYGYQLKLGSSALSSIIHKPFEDLLGGIIYNNAFKNIAKNAPIEGNTKNSAKSLKNYYKEIARVDKWLKSIWQIAAKGETTLDKQMDKMYSPNKFGDFDFKDKNKTQKIGEFISKTIGADHIPIIDLLTTDPHAMIKEPIKRATYESAYNAYMNWVADNIGSDAVNDPLVLQTVKNSAFLRAKSEIFMGNSLTENGTANPEGWTGFLSRLNDSIMASRTEAITEGNNAQYALSSLYKFFLPIVKVPTNIITRAIKGNPIVLTRNIIKAINTNAKIENGDIKISNEEADAIIRDLKKGTITSAYWIAGFLLAGAVAGGFYNPFYSDEERKRRRGVAKSNEILLGQKKHSVTDLMIHGAEHTSQVTALMLGATFWLTMKHYNIDEKESLGYAIEVATAATLKATGEQHPIFNLASDFINATQSERGLKRFGKDIARRFDVERMLKVNPADYYNNKLNPEKDSTSPQVNSVPVKSTPVSSMPIVPRPVK